MFVPLFRKINNKQCTYSLNFRYKHSYNHFFLRKNQYAVFRKSCFLYVIMVKIIIARSIILCLKSYYTLHCRHTYG